MHFVSLAVVNWLSAMHGMNNVTYFAVFTIWRLLERTVTSDAVLLTCMWKNEVKVHAVHLGLAVEWSPLPSGG